MIVYRFSSPRYAGDISGTGARLKGGRWNPPGIAVLYSSAHISLALLEVLANAGTLEELDGIQLAEIEVPENSIYEIKKGELKKEWWNDFAYTRWLGEQIIRDNKFLLLKCPSAVVEQESNYLVNPNHELFAKVKLLTQTTFRFDARLFKQ
ncbi:RES family NAD+ phosphorylase [Foetidibacter luteolus]|uniref:RES family NAD+ phosphorylase n=1 Tax=Foetidibacter luteolus TaxID=2608880 RepID=UPI00129BCF16|nr:RES family NAD+ phosphorylase [Foetidibacter luteolus]